jgi:molecular chaperone HscB
MNYFELFELPVSLKVDKQGLSKKYFDLQKKNHPDYFGTATDAEKDAALETSSQINKAFKTFQSHDETIKYVLQLKGLLEEEEKYTLPPDFLMEVLELNEMKMDGASQEEINTRTNDLQEQIYDEVSTIIDRYDEIKTPEEELLRVKAYYYKKKYLDRLLKPL